jgi:hypothetical protein
MMPKIKFAGLLFFLWVLLISVPVKAEEKSDQLNINSELAGHFAALALKCIEKEYPNNPSHLMNDETELWSPKIMHPAFYGCFDWHSAVHGHWMLIRLLIKYPDLADAERIRNALDHNLTEANINKEVHYFQQKSRRSFERTYGWAWLLKLAEQLDGWRDPQGMMWRKNIQPLEKEIVKQYLDFLPKQTYPIRTGVHPNTAFGLSFALDYARKTQNKELENLIMERSLFYFSNDKNCPASWEPGGEDFFSPCLMEADLMRRVLSTEDFQKWFYRFLPNLKDGAPAVLLNPATVTDRSDGKLVHLDGLNLSRSWCMKHIASVLQENNPVRRILIESAKKHACDALKNISSGDYAGEHWLASFATYLLTE